MKIRLARVGIAPAVLFFATGAFWVDIVLTGGGGLLLWAALTCFASGVLLIAASSNWAARPLAAASSLFGLTLALYQLYVASTLFEGRLGTVATYSILPFAVITAFYLYLLFASARKRAGS